MAGVSSMRARSGPTSVRRAEARSRPQSPVEKETQGGKGTPTGTPTVSGLVLAIRGTRCLKKPSKLPKPDLAPGPFRGSFGWTKSSARCIRYGSMPRRSPAGSRGNLLPGPVKQEHGMARRSGAIGLEAAGTLRLQTDDGPIRIDQAQEATQRTASRYSSRVSRAA